jgi:ABC-type sulfate/molybdate transport systems ATPase subunit
MLDSLTRAELQDVLLELLDETDATAILVTHDVDEALLLADRVVLMTAGPRAHIGEIVEVPFGRNRVRAEVLEDPRYYPLRGRLIEFLEEQDRKPHAAAASEEVSVVEAKATFDAAEPAEADAAAETFVEASVDEETVAA